MVRASALNNLKAWSLYSFAGLWLALFALLPSAEGAETRLGASIGQAFSAFGATLVLWAPIFGTLYALKWWRRKTH